MADAFGAVNVKTQDVGDVSVKFDPANNGVDVVKLGGTTLPVAGKIPIDGVNSTDVPSNITKLGGTTLPVPGKIPIDGVNSTDVPTNVTKLGGTTLPVAGKIPIDGVNSTNIPANITQLGGTNLPVAGKVPIDGVNSTKISTDLTSIGGTNIPVPGKIAIDGVNSTPLNVNIIGTSGTAQYTYAVSASPVSQNGGTANVNAALITATTTGKLINVKISASVYMKAEIQTFNGTVGTAKATLFTPNGGGTTETDFFEGVISMVGDGTDDRFRIVFTNLDKRDAADAYAHFTWVEE